MSRRGRHGRHQNPVPGGRPRPAAQATEPPASPVEARIPARPEAPAAADDAETAEARVAVGQPMAAGPGAAVAQDSVELSAATPAPRPAPFSPPRTDAVPVRADPAPVAPVRPAPPPFAPTRLDLDAEDSRPTCTAAQLRRFIKSRPWIPMHELRRRFGIYGGDDDVSPIRVGEHTLFIGLPPAEGRLMAELLGAGDVGYELSLDPVTPIVVGVYPMRPVPRG